MSASSFENKITFKSRAEPSRTEQSRARAQTKPAAWLAEPSGHQAETEPSRAEAGPKWNICSRSCYNKSNFCFP